MEIITTSVGILFAAGLAVLAATPALLGIYLELRAQKHPGARPGGTAFPPANPPPVPFNYPPVFAAERTRETERSSVTVPVAAQQKASDLLAVYPPPVPFNSQIFWRSVPRFVKHR
jgi:hypothetical protein